MSQAIDEEIAKPGHGKYTVEITKNNVTVKQLDLNSLKSVKNLADQLLVEEAHIDLLVCNAGIMVSIP